MTADDRRRMAEAASWPVSTELLAQLVELTGVLAADMRLKGEPRKVPRPKHLTVGGRSDRDRSTADGQQDGFKQAIGVLKSTSRGNVFVMATPPRSGQ